MLFFLLNMFLYFPCFGMFSLDEEERRAAMPIYISLIMKNNSINYNEEGLENKEENKEYCCCKSLFYLFPFVWEKSLRKKTQKGLFEILQTETLAEIIFFLDNPQSLVWLSQVNHSFKNIIDPIKLNLSQSFYERGINLYRRKIDCDTEHEALQLLKAANVLGRQVYFDYCLLCSTRILHPAIDRRKNEVCLYCSQQEAWKPYRIEEINEERIRRRLVQEDKRKEEDRRAAIDQQRYDDMLCNSQMYYDNLERGVYNY